MVSRLCCRLVAPQAKHTSSRHDGRRSKARGSARERLLSAASDVFSERGYVRAPVEEIAERAGVTKGAFYWHFKTKQDIFLALVEERIDRRARELMQITESASKQGDSAPAVSRGLAGMIDEQREVFLLMHEYWSLAVREPALLEGYVERLRALRSDLARALEVRHHTTGLPLRFPALDLATAILALGNGLAIDRTADPQAIAPELFGEILGLLYDGLAWRARD